MSAASASGLVSVQAGLFRRLASPSSVSCGPGDALVRLVQECRSRYALLQSMRDVYALWHDMVASGYEPSSAVLSCAIVTFHTVGSHVTALCAFRQWPGVRLSTAAYKAVLAAAYDVGDVDATLCALERLEASGIPLTRSQHEMLLAMCLAAEDKDKSKMVLDTLAKLSGKLSPHVLEHVVTEALRWGNTRRAAFALEQVFAYPQMLVLDRDVSLVKRLVEDATAHADADALLVGLRCYALAGVVPDTAVVVTGLGVAARRGRPKLGEELLRMLRDSGREVVEGHHSAVIQAYTAAHDVVGACRALIRAAAQGVSLAPQVIAQVAEAILVSGRTSTDILSACEEETQGCALPAVVLGTMLDALGARGASQEALSLVHEMPLRFGYKPWGDAYAAVLEACALPWALCPDTAAAVVGEMAAKDVRFTPRCYTALALLIVRDGDPERVGDVIKKARSDGTTIGKRAHVIRVRALARGGDADAAARAMADMEADGFALSQVLQRYVTVVVASGGVDYRDVSDESFEQFASAVAQPSGRRRDDADDEGTHSTQNSVPRVERGAP